MVCFSFKNMLQGNDTSLKLLKRFILNLWELEIFVQTSGSFSFTLYSSPGFLSDCTVAFMVIKIAQALQNMYKK